MHPTFRERDEAFIADAATRGWIIGHTRTEATWDQQYALWLKGVSGNGPYAVAPWAIGPMTPFGWQQIGSLHMPQRDYFSHAADYWFSGCTVAQAHALALVHGIGFYVPDEPWHGAWFQGTYIFPDLWVPPPPPPPPPPPKEPSMAKLVRADDGDAAIFLTDGVWRSWVRDGNAFVNLRDNGIAEAALDGGPILITRAALLSLALAGPPAQYTDPNYNGPRTV